MSTRLLKRIAVGRPISTHDEGSHRLSKKVALAVFSSDAMSSSAYATDEILLVLATVGAVAIAWSVPIALVVAVVLSVVIFSYRQTVRAYPEGGGAYIVAHENLGVLPGLVAASALLIDYVLTVAVSLSAGVAAVGAAFPEMIEHRVALAVAVVAFITYLNLRGMKESGSIFAVPTYGFLICMAIMILFGAFRVLFTDFTPPPAPVLHAEGALTIFVLMRAFASGSTALTGVEAISDGVPAFRSPESKNAATTLLILAIILTFLFLGITFLSQAFNVDPAGIEEGRTVTSQIARGVFGDGSMMFFLVQAFTALILFLAANTAYADFPRLASILARDRYLPTVFLHRGDRLAFSNGILILAVAAGGLLINYDADVHQIIPLYVVGVFTSFTLSQAGMVRYAFTKKRLAEHRGEPPPPHFKRKVAISGVGAVTTFIVLIIVAVTKFFAPRMPSDLPGSIRGGAWQVMVVISLFVFILYKIRAHYTSLSAQLRPEPGAPAVHTGKVILVLTRPESTVMALGFARAIAPRGLRVVALGMSAATVAKLRSRWKQMSIRIPIEDIGRGTKALNEVAGLMKPTIDEPVTLILPEPQYKSWIGQLIFNRRLLMLKRAFLYRSDIVVASVPYRRRQQAEPARLRIPTRLSLIVVLSAVNRASMRAIEYARSLNPSEIKAMSVQTQPGEAAKLTDQWAVQQIDIPLEIVDSPYRSLIEPVLREVRSQKPSPDDVVGVVVPEFVLVHWWQFPLHNHTAFLIKSALLFEPNVVVINVPYRVKKDRELKRAPAAAAGAGLEEH